MSDEAEEEDEIDLDDKVNHEVKIEEINHLEDSSEE